MCTLQIIMVNREKSETRDNLTMSRIYDRMISGEFRSLSELWRPKRVSQDYQVQALRFFLRPKAYRVNSVRFALHITLKPAWFN